MNSSGVDCDINISRAYTKTVAYIGAVSRYRRRDQSNALARFVSQTSGEATFQPPKGQGPGMGCGRRTGASRYPQINVFARVRAKSAGDGKERRAAWSRLKSVPLLQIFIPNVAQLRGREGAQKGAKGLSPTLREYSMRGSRGLRHSSGGCL